jgi:hypothetical protein
MNLRKPGFIYESTYLKVKYQTDHSVFLSSKKNFNDLFEKVYGTSG